MTSPRDDCAPLQKFSRLSVVIPNYNHGSVIANAISAFARQIPAPDEIIVVDDGSTDDSVPILMRLLELYPTLRILRLEANQGTVAAMNQGLRAARGTYVNFGASDDLTHQGLFAATLSCLERNPAAAYACTEALVVTSGRRHQAQYRPPVLPSHVESFFPPVGVAKLLHHMDNFVLTGSAVIRRELIIAAGGFDPALGSFADGLLLRQLALQYGFCFIPRVGLTWNINPSGFSRSEAQQPERSFRMMHEALARMRSDPRFPVWYPEVFERRWRFGLGRIASSTTPMNKGALLQLARGRSAGAVLRIATLLGGRVGRYLSLACLTIQERPMSMTRLFTTVVFRIARARGTGWRPANDIKAKR